MKRIFCIAGVVIIAILIGISKIHTNETDADVMNESVRVGVILNGEVDDGSWSQSHYEALEKTAEQLELSICYRQKVAEEQAYEVIRQLIADDCKVIVANSVGYEAAMTQAAADYPDIYFLHATGTKESRNMSSYFGRMYQIRYLSGIVAGMQTRTNEIGYVAAFPISEVNRGVNAFTLGVRRVNPNAKVYVTWTYSWNDDEVTREATAGILDKYNIDVLAMHTDSLTPLDVAEERGIMCIGYNMDNCGKYSDNYLTAAVWNWENYYVPNILTCLQGKFEGNHCWAGVETGVVSLASFSNKVDKKTAELIGLERQKLSSGTYDVFYGPIVDNKGNLRVKEGENMTDEVMLNQFDWYVEGVVDNAT